VNLLELSAAAAAQIISITDGYVENMRSRARESGRDAFALIAADILGVDYCDITRAERNAVKHGLFWYHYSGLAPR
jgi:hypothetical protein